MFYHRAAMVTCPICRRPVAVYELANADGYRGEGVATCAASATAGYRSQERVHRLERRDPTRHERLAHRSERAGFRPDAAAREEVWLLCDRCLAYIEDRRVVRMKADGTMLRLLNTESAGRGQAGRCATCMQRPATRQATLRVASP